MGITAAAAAAAAVAAVLSAEGNRKVKLFTIMDSDGAYATTINTNVIHVQSQCVLLCVLVCFKAFACAVARTLALPSIKK